MTRAHRSVFSLVPKRTFLDTDTEGYLDPTGSGVTRYFSGLTAGEFMSLLPGSQYRIRHEESVEVPAMGHNFWIAVLSKDDAI